jgi:group I intron endonuclease
MFIYLVTNTVNGKYYVGQTYRKPLARLRAHFCAARGGSPWRLHIAMRKYPEEAFIQDVLAVTDGKAQTDALERLWITALDAMNFDVGYNAAPGGDSRSKESSAKAGAKMRGNQWNVGYKHTKEACDNMAASADGHAVAQSTRDKISATRKAKIASGEIKMPAGALTHWIGKTQSAESNRKRSVTLAGKYVGELNSMFGKKWTPAHRANIMKAREEKRNV